MNALPAALRPWRTWLDWFEIDRALALGDVMLRLNPLLGRIGARSQGGELEPDGIDDLRQRGPYERLVLSEWMLADALPDEFVRRAAHNEHLFLAPKLVHREAERVLVAVFDAGPAQWGATRLAHVALWILLARRASSLGARLLWGLAQQPGSLHEADTPDALRKLLQARTHALPTDADWQAWEKQLGDGRAAGSERWLVSSGRASPPVFSHFADFHRGFGDQLRARLGTRESRREAKLPLPATCAAIAILNGDFMREVPSTAHRRFNGRFGLQQAPLFNDVGARIALPMQGESRAVIFKIQDKTENKLAKPRFAQWAMGGEVVFAVMSGKSFGAVIAYGNRLQFWNLPGFDGLIERPAEFKVTPGRSRWLPAAWFNSGSDEHRLVVLDSARNLISWAVSMRPLVRGPREDCKRLDDHVLGICRVDANHLAYARVEGDGKLVMKMLQAKGSSWLVTALPMADTPTSVHFAGEVGGHRHWSGAVCVESRSTQRGGDRSTKVSLFRGEPSQGFRETGFVMPPEARIIGVGRDGDDPDNYHVLYLDARRRRLMAAGANGTEALYESPADISGGSVSGDGESVALVDLDGQLLVFAGGGRRLSMCLRGEHAAVRPAPEVATHG